MAPCSLLQKGLTHFDFFLLYSSTHWSTPSGILDFILHSSSNSFLSFSSHPQFLCPFFFNALKHTVWHLHPSLANLGAHQRGLLLHRLWEPQFKLHSSRSGWRWVMKWCGKLVLGLISEVVTVKNQQPQLPDGGTSRRWLLTWYKGIQAHLGLEFGLHFINSSQYLQPI